MAEKRRYVRMSTVFPVELEIYRNNGEKCSSHVLQAFTKDISAGGMCLELKSFGKETEKLLSIADSYLALTINTTFAKNPIRALARIVWLSRKEIPLPTRYFIGVTYTDIDPKAKRRIIRHAKRLLWVPRVAAVAGLIGAALLIGYALHNQGLIAENRVLVYQLLDSAARRSDIAVSLYDLQKRKTELESALNSSRREIESLTKELASAAGPGAAVSSDYEQKLSESQAKEKRITEELRSLQEGQVKLQASYQELQRSAEGPSEAILNQMFEWIGSHRNLKTGLVSSFEGDPSLSDWGFTYDQSLSAQVLLLAGDTKAAFEILDFFDRRAQRSGDGFFNAYDAADGRVLESSVQTGPNIWIGIAALQYQNRVKDGRFMPMAVRLGDWVIGLQDAEGGVKGGPGHEWFSTEHNLDAYAYLKMLHTLTNEERFNAASQKVLSWLKKYAYTLKEKRMVRGKGDATIATDTFSWAIAAIGPEVMAREGFDAEAIMQYAEEHCLVELMHRQPDGKITRIRGFDFAKAQNVGRGGIISTEWTAQAIVTYRILEAFFAAHAETEKAALYANKANLYLSELQKLTITSPSRTGQGRGCLPYASHDNADTGHGWRTPKGTRTGSVAGTSYGIFAWLGYNPFELNDMTRKGSASSEGKTHA